LLLAAFRTAKSDRLLAQPEGRAPGAGQAIPGSLAREPAHDLTDASLVWLGGEIGVTDIVTVDDAGFAAYRTVSGKAFRNLLPPRRK